MEAREKVKGSDTAGSRTIVSPAEAFGVQPAAVTDPVLAKALGRQPTDEEVAAWAAMPASNRSQAIARIAAMRRWQEERGELTAAEAAQMAQVNSKSRFYEMAAAWERSGGSLFDVGRFAKPQSDRKPRFDPTLINDLQAAVARLGKDHKNRSISKLVERMVTEVDPRGRTMPSVNTLRVMAARELRRLKAEGQVGTRPGLDVTGTGLFHADGSQHLVFALVDRTSKLVLGWATGSLNDSVAAYAAVARDAHARMATVAPGTMPWAPSASRLDIVVGSDEEQWAAIKAAWPRGEAVEMELVTAARRYGRYFRSVIGPRIGRLTLTSPTVRESDMTAPIDPTSTEDAVRRIGLELAEHNAAVLERLIREVDGEASPARELLQTLEHVGRLG